MGYDIYIGEAEPYVPEDRDDRESFETLHVVVNRVVHPEAPAFPNDTLSANSNNRHPSYSTWANFARECCLYDVLVSGWIKQHPGAVLLTKSHLARIKKSRSAWQKSRPGAVPGFGRNGRDHYDSTLACLLWLEWWCEHALANCRIPTVYNR